MASVGRWWGVVLLAACDGGPQKVDDGPTGDDDDTPTCTEDEDCLPLIEVCSAEGFCEAGDRDDVFDRATPLFLGEDQARPGVISVEGDVDTFAYESPGDEWVSVRTVVTDEVRESGLDTILTLHQSNGAVHAEIDDFPVYPFRVTGFDSVLYAYLPTAGTWFLSVQDASSYYEGLDPVFGEDLRYEVLVREAFGINETDSVESPGGTFDLPDGNTILSLGVNIGSGGDVDHIAIDHPTDQILEIWSAPGLGGSTATPKVELYEGDTLLARKEGVGEAGWVSWLEPHAGDFRIAVSDAAGASGPDAWFPIFARTYEPDDFHPFFADNEYIPEAEPNDVSAGFALPPDVVDDGNGGQYTAFRLQGRIDTPSDVDPWVATVPAASSLSVRCWTDRFGSLAELEVTLSTVGTPFASSAASDDEDYYLVGVAAPATAIELTVSDAAGTSGASAWYRCALYAQ